MVSSTESSDLLIHVGKRVEKLPSLCNDNGEHIYTWLLKNIRVDK